MRRLYAALVLMGTASPAVAPPLAAQAAAVQPPGAQPPATDSITQLVDGYLKAHLALGAVRDREQAELAEPRSKKPEVQMEIRERYRGLRTEALKAVGYTEAKYSAMTKRMSTDDGLRQRFEAALAKTGAR